MITLAVLTMPAPDALRQNFYQEGEEFTFVPGSTVDYIGLAGSMAVLIPFDIDQEKLRFLLDKSDGLVLSSCNTELTDSNGQFTPFMSSVSMVLDYVVKRNNQGKYFPVLAIGNGMDALIKNVTKNRNTMVCDSNSSNTTKIVTPEGQHLEITLEWRSFFQDTKNQEALKSGTLYFDNACRVEVSEFENDRGVSTSYYYMASSENGGKKYVEAILHRIQPIIGFHFHAEKHIFERGAPHQLLDRSEETIDFLKRIILNLRKLIASRGSPKLLKNISSQLRQYFAMFRPAELPLVDRWERVYTFQRYHGH
jgi:gamma-glutamyl-gamma-aminobutyrate hydrolase PuuD